MMDPKSIADPLDAGKCCTVAVTAIVIYFDCSFFFELPDQIFQSFSSDPRDKNLV
jgi:hypothetical protein